MKSSKANPQVILRSEFDDKDYQGKLKFKTQNRLLNLQGRKKKHKRHTTKDYLDSKELKITQNLV